MRLLLRAVLWGGALLSALPCLAAPAPGGIGATGAHRAYVVLSDEPVLTYSGGLTGYTATKSARPGDIDLKSPAVRQYKKHLTNRQSAVAKAASQVDPGFKERRRFDLLVNAIVCDLDPTHWPEIERLPGVLAVVPEREYRPFLSASNPLMNVSEVWGQLGGSEQAGRGIKIGILDTGVDPSHPMLSGEGFSYPPGFPRGDLDATNEKVIVARVFHTAENANGMAARDRDGHGTHVAACAAGNLNTQSPIGAISGVAPGAWIGNYNLLIDGFSTDELILAALEAAALDGMDILNLSFGSDRIAETDFHPVLVAIRNLTALGTTVVVAAGNFGNASGSTTLGFPAQSPEAITVGAVGNAHLPTSITDPRGLSLTVSVDGVAQFSGISAQLAMSLDPLAYSPRGTFELLSADLLADGEFGIPEDGNACTPLTPGSADGAWVLLSAGDDDPCLPAEQVLNLQAAGAVGVVVFPRDEQTVMDWTLDGTDLPVAEIDREVGMQIFSLFQNAEQFSVTSTGEPVEVTPATPYFVSSFSSRGPGPGGSIKPEVIAVGQNSYAAVQDDFMNGGSGENMFHASGFQFAAGTSFSAPRVAGTAALIKQAHPDWTPDQIRAAVIAGTELPATLTGRSITVRGAGHLLADRALDPPFLLDPPLLAFGVDDANGDERTYERTFRITPLQSSSMTLSLSGVLTQAEDAASVEISPSTLSLNPASASTVDVTLTVQPPESGESRETEGYLRIAVDGSDDEVLLHFFQRTNGVPATTPGADILLVDDDGGADFAETIRNDIEAAGETVAVWDVDARERFPSRHYLESAETVIWYLGSYSLNTPSGDGPPDIELLKKLDAIRIEWFDALIPFLENGGSLLLLGQDYTDIPLAENDEVNQYEFTQALLRMEDLVRDTPIDTIRPAEAGDLGLTFPEQMLHAPFDLFVDELVPHAVSLEDGSAKVEAVDALDPGAAVAYSLVTSRYRALFFAFPLLGLDDGSRADVLIRSLDWLTSNQPEEFAVTDVLVLDSTDGSEGADLRVLGSGFAALRGWGIQVGDRRLGDVSRESEGVLTGTLAALPPPGVYDLTVVSPGGLQATLRDALTVTDEGQVGIAEWAMHGGP